MAILEAVVIATIILAGAWIGYHAWQDSLHEKADSHNITTDHQVFGNQLLQINEPSDIDLNPVIKPNLH